MDSEAHDLPTYETESVNSLTQDILHDVQDLIRQHIDLAKSDLRQSSKEAVTALIPLVLGGVFGVLGLAFLLVTAVWALSTYTQLPLWASYGIIALICLGVGAMLAQIGRSKMSGLTHNSARHATEAAKENIAWLKERTVARRR